MASIIFNTIIQNSGLAAIPAHSQPSQAASSNQHSVENSGTRQPQSDASSPPSAPSTEALTSHTQPSEATAKSAAVLQAEDSATTMQKRMEIGLTRLYCRAKKAKPLIKVEPKITESCWKKIHFIASKHLGKDQLEELKTVLAQDLKGGTCLGVSTILLIQKNPNEECVTSSDDIIFYQSINTLREIAKKKFAQSKSDLAKLPDPIKVLPVIAWVDAIKDMQNQIDADISKHLLPLKKLPIRKKASSSTADFAEQFIADLTQYLESGATDLLIHFGWGDTGHTVYVNLIEKRLVDIQFGSFSYSSLVDLFMDLTRNLAPEYQPTYLFHIDAWTRVVKE